MASARSQLRWSVSAPPTAAPTPTNAIWPRLTWPAQPLSTTSEAATMPKITMIVARLSRLVDSHIGRVSTNTPTTAQQADAPPHDLGQPPHLLRDGADLAGGLPGGRGVGVDPAGARSTPGHEQADQHDAEQDRVVVGRLVPGLERHRLVDDAEADGGGRRSS